MRVRVGVYNPISGFFDYNVNPSILRLRGLEDNEIPDHMDILKAFSNEIRNKKDKDLTYRESDDFETDPYKLPF